MKAILGTQELLLTVIFPNQMENTRTYPYFAYSGAKIWNDIPTKIKNSVSLESVKGAYLRKYFN